MIQWFNHKQSNLLPLLLTLILCSGRNGLHFHHLLYRLTTLNLIIAPSLKVRVCWSNIAAYAKSRAFRDRPRVVAWLVTGIFGFVQNYPLLSIWGVNCQQNSEDSSLWKLSQKKVLVAVLWWRFNRLSLGKEFTFIQTFGKRPEHLARREMSRFLSSVEYACLCAT